MQLGSEYWSPTQPGNVYCTLASVFVRVWCIPLASVEVEIVIRDPSSGAVVHNVIPSYLVIIKQYAEARQLVFTEGTHQCRRAQQD